MYIAMNRMTVLEEDREHFEHLFKTRARAVDRRPGFIRAEILRPAKGTTYIVMTHWKDKDSFMQWTKSDEYREGHQRIGDFRGSDGRFRLSSEIETYEVIAE